MNFARAWILRLIRLGTGVRPYTGIPMTDCRLRAKPMHGLKQRYTQGPTIAAADWHTCLLKECGAIGRMWRLSMPIRPENKARYPKDWPAISRRIRFERANNQCEFCGVQNYELGGRTKDGQWHKARITGCDRKLPDPGSHWWCDGPNGAHMLRIVKIILTVAHLDHVPENCDDDNPRRSASGATTITTPRCAEKVSDAARWLGRQICSWEQ